MAVYQIPYNGNWCASIPGINWEFRTLQEQIDALGGGTGTAGNIYVPLEYPGVLTDETLFGYWVVPQACEVLGLILYVGEVATGNNITVDITDGAGAEFGQISTLVAGAEFQATIFATPISLATSATIRAKTKSIGSSTTEGAFLTALAIISYT